MRMPTSKSGGAKFRGPTSSHEYNINEDQKFLELLELYNQVNHTQLTLEEAYEIVLLENSSLHQYANMLEEKITNLENKIQSLSTNGRFFKTGFVQDMHTNYPNAIQNESDQTPRCEMNMQHRYATIPYIHRIPKTHSVDSNGNYILPSELKVNVRRSSKKGVISDNDIHSMFDGNNSTFWRRTVTYDSNADVPVNGEDAIIEIELPMKLVNNLNINTITIHPHPERGIEINNIEVHYNNSWQTIQGFLQEDITSISSHIYSPRKTWYFPNIPIQKIRITLVQKNPIMNGESTVFSLGLQEVGVYLSTFEPSGGMVLVPISMSGVYNIESVEFNFLNRQAFSYPKNMEYYMDGNIYQYELYTEEADKTLRPIPKSGWSSQTAKRIWIKAHLYTDPHNGVTPCLHAVRLHYTKA